MEKRNDKRQSCEASIAWGCFNKERMFNARMLNFSKDGMYLESDAFYKEGTNIFFKMKDCLLNVSDQENPDGLRSVSLGVVKWWKALGGEDTSPYGIGVKYY